MRKLLLFALLFMSALLIQMKAQNVVPIFNKVLFYDGYNNLEALANEMEPTPDGVFRLRTSLITTKLSDDQLLLLNGAIRMDVILKASCDNYDRIGYVSIALVPKDSAMYNPDEVQRLEIARFITPFMNKNRKPDTVPYTYRVDYLQHLFQDSMLRSQFDFWIELDVFGVPYAANEQVAGCDGRSDVFYGTLTFTTSEIAEDLETDNVFIPLFMHHSINNYAPEATDTIGQTIKSIDFTLDEDLADAQFILITSNHGANSGGEEYNRRWHYIYLNDNEILRYKPGRISCEPFRMYNTQGNGIYGNYVKTDAQWQSFSNWCPGDIIDTRIIKLGALNAGNYKFKIKVPDAIFNDNQGYFPLSLYFQGKTNQVIAGKYTITGRVLSSVGKPVNGVNFGTVLGLTSPFGDFTVLADSNATITLTPELQGYTFEPKFITLSAISQNITDQNFVATSEMSVKDIVQNYVSVYSTPNINEVYVELKSQETENYTVYNIMGQSVMQGHVQNMSVINLGSLTTGMYYIRILDRVFKVVRN